MNFADQSLPELTTISASQPLNLLCKGDKCEMKDYFDIWVNETSSKVFSQTSRKKLYQTASYSHWYDVFYYVKFWWTEVIKKLCSMATCISDKIWINAEALNEVMSNEIVLFESEIEPDMEIESLPHENSSNFVMLYCIIGGLCLITFLLYRRRVKCKRRQENILSPSDIKEIETNIIQKLIKFIREGKSIKENGFFTFTEFGKHEGVKEILTRRGIAECVHNIQQKPSQEQISKVKKQCKLYQNQIRVLEEQLYDLLKNHRAEVDRYFAKYRKIELELDKTQNRLDLSHHLHKNETAHLQEYIAQLQAQYENINEYNIQRLTCQCSFQDVQNHFQSIEEICSEPRRIIAEVLNRTSSAPAALQVQNETTDEIETQQEKNRFQGSEDHLQLTEDDCIPSKQSQVMVQVQGQRMNNNAVRAEAYKYNLAGDQHFQLTEEIRSTRRWNLSDNLSKPSSVKAALQTQYKKANEFGTQKYRVQNAKDEIQLTESSNIGEILCKPSSIKLVLQSQHKYSNTFKSREHKCSIRDDQLIEEGIKPNGNSTGGSRKEALVETSLQSQFNGTKEFKIQNKCCIRDSRKDLQLTAVSIKPKCNLNIGIDKPSSLKVPSQTQFKKTEFPAQQTKCSLQNVQDDASLREEVCINPKRNLSARLNKPPALRQSQYRNANKFNKYTNTQDDLHLTEASCTKLKYNLIGAINQPSSVNGTLQAQYKNSNEFNTYYEDEDEDEYVLQDIDYALQLPYEGCTKPKPNSNRVLNKPSPIIVTSQTPCNRTNEFRIQQGGVEYIRQDVEDDLQLTFYDGCTPKAKPSRTKTNQIIESSHPQFNRIQQAKYDSHRLQGLQHLLLTQERCLTSPVEAFSQTDNSKDSVEQSELDPYVVASLKRIQSIFEDTKELKRRVKYFKGSRNDEAYFRLKDILIQLAIELNNIQCEGYAVLKKKSNKTWTFINKCRTFLESKTLK